MADNDKDIWESALTDEPAEEVQVEQEAQPEPEQPETIAVARDEHGRFAPKPEAEPEKVKAEEPERGPPAWRLKEEADARRSAEQRAAQLEQQLQQFMRQQEQAKPAPDIFENPGAFVDQGVRSQVDPIKSELAQMREEFSLQRAITSHGEEKVQAAYKALADGMQSNPAVNAVYQQAMASRDPYKVILDWHQKETVYKTIGNDPDAYAKSRALELAKADPEFQKALLGLTREAVQQARPSAINLPPSLGRVSGSVPRTAEDDDNSEAGLFRQATR
jgi:riboflavin biosynthesis pyrimidine reductase